MKAQGRKNADIRFEDHGTVSLIRPLTHKGVRWVTEHVEAEPWQVFGSAVAAEPRMLDAVITGAMTDGLILDLGPEC